MVDAQVDFSGLKATGQGTCHGGAHPHPPFHNYPLLSWMHAGHERHGGLVFTEDQKANVQDIAVAFLANPDLAALAAQHGTTAEHVRQAVEYAAKASFLV
jgi:hypothetical protein